MTFSWTINVYHRYFPLVVAEPRVKQVILEYQCWCGRTGILGKVKFFYGKSHNKDLIMTVLLLLLSSTPHRNTLLWLIVGGLLVYCFLWLFFKGICMFVLCSGSHRKCIANSDWNNIIFFVLGQFHHSTHTMGTSNLF